MVGDDGVLYLTLKRERDMSKEHMHLQYIGRQGSCRYYWRLFCNGSRALYAIVDGGSLQPVAM